MGARSGRGGGTGQFGNLVTSRSFIDQQRKAAAAAFAAGSSAVGALFGGGSSRQSRQHGGFLNATGPFNGHRGEFVIRRRAAQELGPAMLRRLNRGNLTVNNTINATDRSTIGTRAQIRAMLPELRRQTRLGVLQGGPF